MEPPGASGIALKGFTDLNGQFPGRCQHQDLGLACIKVNARQQWQGKSSGLACSGLGLTEQITAEHQLRNGCGLDR